MWVPRAGLAALALLVLARAGATNEDVHKPPPDPDLGFLEFLGSVDRLAELNPDYLAQANTAARPPIKPPAPPPPAPPPSASTPGDKKND